MKNIKKNAINALVLVALFAPVALADGEMGGGGLAGTVDNTGDRTVTVMTTEERQIGADAIMGAIFDCLKLIM